jgi:hypothetical protein
MKLSRINSIAVFILISNLTTAQLIVENFEYSTGVLTDLTTSWIELPTGSTDIEVVSGNLSYTGYPSSGTGNMIFVDGGALSRSGITREFGEISGDGNSIYCSFLLSLNDISDLDLHSTTGDYFFEFKPSTGTTMKAYIYIRQGSSGNTFNLGIAKSSPISLIWASQDLTINTSYLIVVSYTFQTGDDAVKFWLNPAIDGAEPESDLIVTSGTEADNLNRIQFRQREFSGNINIDGIRVGTSWSDAPLPVELLTFDAVYLNNKVLLSWATATEVNNYGWWVERSGAGIGNNSPITTRNWQVLNFVPGAGNSNSVKSYTYIDKIDGFGKVFYRLKQTDTDGSYTYSNIVEVTINPQPAINNLFQNYPNPCNSSTTVKFILHKDSKVKLALYDLPGRETVLINNELLGAGENQYFLDFENINSIHSSGIYFLKIVTNNYSGTIKILYVK